MTDKPSDTAQILALLQKQAEQSRYLAQLRVQRAWDEEMKKPRHADPKRLVRYGYKVYCQNDEDGIIAEIFRRIGTTSRTFVEFGVETGVAGLSIEDSTGDPANPLYDFDLAVARVRAARAAIDKAGGKVVLTAVTAGHDFGNQIEILAGLTPNEQVIINPPDSIVSGQAVQIVQATLPGDAK